MQGQVPATKSVERTRRLYDQIYNILWEKLLAGEFEPGQRLRDLELAQLLGVSRTPVREAMRKLEQEGLLDPLDTGGYEIRDVGPKDLNGLYRCRAVLESLAARDAAGRITKDDCDQLDALIEETDRHIAAKALSETLDCNTRFHQVIIEASGNRYLMSLLESLQRLIVFNRSWLLNKATQSPEVENRYANHLQTIQDDHRRIVKHLRNADPDGAAAAMEQHLFGTADDMDAVLREVRPASGGNGLGD